MRTTMLRERALPSIYAQTYAVDAIAIANDTTRTGAWTTRNNAIAMAKTDWVALLDDDDELLPHHLELLIATAEEQQADVVWGWFEVIGGSDPFPSDRGRQWNVNEPHVFPISTLIRRDLILAANAEFTVDAKDWGSWYEQDFPFWKAIHDIGGKFYAIPDITWRWYHHGKNTSGLPSRW